MISATGYAMRIYLLRRNVREICVILSRYINALASIGMFHAEDILVNIYCSYNAYLRLLAYSYKSSRSFLNANAEHGVADTDGKLSIAKLSNR